MSLVDYSTGVLLEDGKHVLASVQLMVGVLPVGQGRMTPVVSASTGKPFAKHTNAKALAQYRADVQQAWDDAIETINLETPSRWLTDKAYAVRVGYYFPRPQSHTTSKGALTKSAPLRHVQKPDVDKLARATLDALTGYAFSDDSRVCDLSVRKRWSDEGGRAGVLIDVSLA